MSHVAFEAGLDDALSWDRGLKPPKVTMYSQKRGCHSDFVEAGWRQIVLYSYCVLLCLLLYQRIGHGLLDLSGGERAFGSALTYCSAVISCFRLFGPSQLWLVILLILHYIVTCTANHAIDFARLLVCCNQSSQTRRKTICPSRSCEFVRFFQADLFLNVGASNWKTCDLCRNDCQFI